MSFLVGKKKSKSKSETSSTSTQDSSNRAFQFLLDTFGGPANVGADALSQLGGFLGIGGAGGQEDAFANFREGTGFNFLLDEALGAVDAGQAGKFNLRSGATEKARIQRATDVAGQSINDFLDRLQGTSQLGLGAGSLISSAGGVSSGRSESSGTSSSSAVEKPGLGGFIGQISGNA